MMRIGRRSVLAAIAAAGTIGAASFASEPDDHEDDSPSRDRQRQSTSREHRLGVEAIDLASGRRTIYSDRQTAETNLDAGRYELVEVTRRGDEIVERPTTKRIEDGPRVTSEGIDLEAEVLWDVTDPGPYGPSATVPLLVGAVEQRDDEPTAPAEGVDLTVTVETPDDEVFETFEPTTEADGNVRVDVPLDDSPTGRYSVEVESEATTESGYTSFTVGTRRNVVNAERTAETGADASLGVFAYAEGSLADDDTIPVTIAGPEADRTIDIALDDGVGIAEFVPSADGEYEIEATAEFDVDWPVTAGEYRVHTPGFGFISDRYFGETASYGGIVYGPDGPASNSGLTVRFTDRSDSETYVERETTTDECGAFAVEFDLDDLDDFFAHPRVAVDGTPAAIDQRVSPEEPPYSPPGGDSGPLHLDATIDAEAPITVETSVDVVAELTENGTPITGETVDLVYTIDGVPLGGDSVATDTDGQATATSPTVPTRTGDEELDVVATAEVDGEFLVGRDEVDIERFDVDVSGRFDLEPGTTTTIDLEVTERSTGDPAEGIQMPLLLKDSFLDAHAYDNDVLETGADGTASATITTPEDVDGIAGLSRSEPGINVTYVTSLNRLEPFGLTVTTDTDRPVPGDTLTVTYETDAAASTTALVSFPMDDGESVVTATEGEPVEVAVPHWLDPGTSAELIVTAVTDDGTAANQRQELTVGDTLAARFGYEPRDPAPGAEIDLYGDSLAPDNIVEREWDLTGDGTTDATGRAVTTTFDTAGEYEVTLSIVDENGDTDERTESITVDVDDLTAKFDIDPGEPSIADAVTFEDRSAAPGGAEIVEYEWDLTGDGTTDATDETASIEYDAPGEYVVTLTVTDENGNTDEQSQSITVSKPSPEDYADDDTGTVETDGLREAIADWRSGDADTETIEGVIDAWSSDDPIDG